MVDAADTPQWQQYIFGPGSENLTYDQLRQRAQIATAMSSKRAKFPQNIGEGIAALGESVGDVMYERRLNKAYSDYQQRGNAAMKTYPSASVGAGAAAAPTGAPPPPTGVQSSQGPDDYSWRMPQQTASGGDDPVWQARMAATKGMESAGKKDPYGITHPPVTRADGTIDYGIGAYGIMASNVPKWSQEALGVQMRPEQLIGNEDAQDAIFRHRFGTYVDKYGEDGAARAWFAGPANMNNLKAKDPLGTTVDSYQKNYMNRLQKRSDAGDSVDAAPTSSVAEDTTNPRDDLATTVADAMRPQGATPEVAQENPTQAGAMSPPLSGGQTTPSSERPIQLAALGGNTMTDAPSGLLPSPPITDPAQRMLPGAGAPTQQFLPAPRQTPQPREPEPPFQGTPIPGFDGPDGKVTPLGPGSELDNPPTPTDIQPAPFQVAQAGGGPVPMPAAGPVAMPPDSYKARVPGPLDEPTQQPSVSVGRLPRPPQYDEQKGRPPEPVYKTTSALEEWGRKILLAFPGDPNYGKQAEMAIEAGRAQRAADYQRDVDIYKEKMTEFRETAAEYRKRADPKYEIELREGENRLQDKAREQRMQQQFGDLGAPYFGDQLKESAKTVAGLPASTAALANARAALNDGMFTGRGAEVQQAWAKWKNALNFTHDDRATPTDAFKAYIAPLMSQLRSAIVGSGAQSNAEFQNLEKAVGGDIKLERGAIESILNSIERLNLQAAVSHQQKVEAFAGNDPNNQRMAYAYFGVKNLEQLVPQEQINSLAANPTPERMRKFDSAYSTPGLAGRVLQSRGPN